MSRDSGAFEPYPEPESVWGYLGERFGLDAPAFAGYRLWQRAPGKAIWLAAHPPPEGLRIEWLGLPVMRQPPPRGFPTNAFLRRFGHLATRNCLDLPWPDALRLMYDHQLEWEAPDPRGGPYIVRSELGPLGRGWVRKGRLVLETPKGWGSQLMARTELAEFGG